MDFLVTGFVAGVIGTLAMDLLNNIVARTGVFLKIDVAMIGRMAAGWTHGRFRYRHPDEMVQVPNEMIYGYLAHFAIGVGLAVPFVLSWDLWVGRPASPVCAVLYGVATTAASFFFVYPSMGLGAFGRRSPDRIKAFITPIANHFFYGVGLAVGVVLV
ncbi:MAG: DUF2938 family protein [Deltaproteobacteria bacterium]|jgi:uncharacterized membrane protein YeaQ/YmgE (transglycosylase-associated protein family)|nr:DUF2938 family protein [Deltaproteobacteria bacterium]MBW2431274.1 DUF2938 family protein [Deltaproteobacteria bacterium]MBW2490029.1 DUF2938 family protein [Deltaproteobacteria bacterium]